MKKKSLLKVIYANEDNLLEQVEAHLFDGADPNERTEYFETPLRVSSNNGRFDVVKFLFESGADPSHLKWTPLFHAVAYGSLQQVKNCMDNEVELEARDTWERTPFLLAIQSGDVEKVNYLIEVGAEISARGRCGKQALEYAIQMDNDEMLVFLVEQGIEFEDYNSFGYTPLMLASEQGAINCVRCLLKLGANIYKTDRSQFSQTTAIAHTSMLEVALTLAEAGDDLNQVEGRVRANLLGLGKQEKLAISKQEYIEQKYRVYGTSNPQRSDIPFLYEMVRCNAAAWQARSQFGDTNNIKDQPIWCYDRYGKSITKIGNNEFIEIAGEHEDSYDPDFCIYNEVIHHKGGGDFTIYQYPKHVFPPTDFHTATLVDGYIYIIGNLGYHAERDYGTTPVYRLNILSFRIEKQETSGENPGWIHKHSAFLSGQSRIRIQGGEIFEEVEEKEHCQFNKFDFELDLNTFKWKKYAHIPKSGIPLFFPLEYKQFRHSDKTLVAVNSDEKWFLIKVVSVYRIDVNNGDEIRFEQETIVAKSDDFLFVVAYSTSKAFDSFELLEKAVNDKSWSFENSCQVCRTTAFPEYSRYIGFSEITHEESESFMVWKTSFKCGHIKII